MTKNIEIFTMDDGFYAGRQLKSGKMAAGSYRITDEDIMTMFTTLYENYVAQTGDRKMFMKTSDGDLFVAMKIPAEEAGEATE